jgi:hypothetical protein
MTPGRVTTLTAAAASFALAGCGIPSAYRKPTTPSSAPAPSRPAAAAVPQLDRRHATHVATAYALASTNWSAATFRGAYRTMVSLSAGSLRADLEANPPDADMIRSLVQERQDHRASLVAASVTSASGRAASVVVVLREQTSAAALASSQPTYNVYRASLSLEPGGWRVTRWEALS